MKIVIAGDFVINQKNIELFENVKIDKILQDKIKDIWFNADFRLFNLEAPICNLEETILKSGPALKNPEACLKGIKALLPNLCLCANNHIKDYKEDGIRNTINLLEKNNIDWVGVGENINNLKKHFIYEKDGYKIAFYNCAETEFNIATDKEYGANPYHDFCTNKDIQLLKTKVDKVVVLYHGGKECYQYPTPQLQKRCRLMVDSGADYVICQHSHCIGCEEKYKNSTIVYGQGNFLFQALNNKHTEIFNSGLLIELEINNESCKINYVPFLQDVENGGIKLFEDENEILNEFYRRSEQIKQENFIENSFKSEVENTTGFYLKMFKQQDWLGILNNLQCETHKEAIECAIKYTNLPQKINESQYNKNKYFGFYCEDIKNGHRLVIKLFNIKFKLKIV